MTDIYINNALISLFVKAHFTRCYECTRKEKVASR